MAPCTKSVRIQIKSHCDRFHELWKANPQQVPSLTPTTIQNCQVLEGEPGTVGCVLLWYYFLDGKDCLYKSLTEEIDEEKKCVHFKGLEGDMLELYKTFDVHIHVDTDGPNNFVTWTVEYEKRDPNDPDPDTLMEFYKNCTKDVETHHLKN